MGRHSTIWDYHYSGETDMRKQTHRELVYDRQHSTRKFKHFMQMTTSGHQVKVAYDMGFTVEHDDYDVPRRWRTNPFKPGTRRHKAYADGVESAKQDKAELATYRRWNR
jgi:hypothetical protein